MIRIITGALSALLLAAPVAAQLPTSARAFGTAGASFAATRGLDALFANPAHLGLPDRPSWSLGLAQIVTGTTVLGPGITDLPAFADLDRNSPERRAELLATVPETGTEVRADARAPLFALTRGEFGLGVSYVLAGQHTVGRDLVELLLNGYEEGRTDYSVAPTEGARTTYYDVVAAAGRQVGRVSLGAAAHYYHGGTRMQSRLFEPRYDLARQDIEVDYVAVLARGGRGYGLDVGAAWQPQANLTVSASVSNLVSRMRWSEDLSLRTLTLHRQNIQTLSGEQARDLLLTYESSERAAKPAEVPFEAYETAQGLYEGTYFPARLHAGTAWKPAGATEISASYQKKISEGKLGDRWDRTVAVGATQRLIGRREHAAVALRVGYATDLGASRMRSGGLSLGPLQLGVAQIVDGSVGGAERTGYVATFGLMMQAHSR